MQERILEWFQVHSAFLYCRIFERGWVYFDYWSFVHTWSGLVLIFLLTALKFKRPWFWLSFFLVAYEALEVAFVFFAVGIFRPERLNDQIMDVLVGLFAAFLGYILLTSLSRRATDPNAYPQVLMLFVSVTCAFVWVGLYGYHYNRQWPGPEHFSLPAFLIWSLAGTLFLAFSAWYEKRVRGSLPFIVGTTAVYLLSLVLIDNAGVRLLGVWNVVHMDNPFYLRFPLHGSPALFLYYAAFPFLIVRMYRLALQLTLKAQVSFTR